MFGTGIQNLIRFFSLIRFSEIMDPDLLFSSDVGSRSGKYQTLEKERWQRSGLEILRVRFRVSNSICEYNPNISACMRGH